MREFRQLLQCLGSFKHVVESLTELLTVQKLKSKRLKILLSSQAEEGLMPSGIEDTVDEFDKLIQWKPVSGASTKTELPEPQRGMDEKYD